MIFYRNAGLECTNLGLSLYGGYKWTWRVLTSQIYAFGEGKKKNMDGRYMGIAPKFHLVYAFLVI